MLLTCLVGVKSMHDLDVATCCITVPGTCEFSVCTHTGVLSGKVGCKDFTWSCLL